MRRIRYTIIANKDWSIEKKKETSLHRLAEVKRKRYLSIGSIQILPYNVAMGIFIPVTKLHLTRYTTIS